ncbi:hypothetical protein IMZ48_03080, partial [Candidatus Bathyarchaeota archaeon]|nr:hypothetical protein [Candidatus Bathyarchaeota archaeon]
MDHAFVTFNNLPPRIMIKEMKMHMARPEGCFQAATGEECLEGLQAWGNHSPVLSTLTFHEVVEMVCRGGMSEEMHQVLANLGPLNLFAVISGKI